MKKATIFTKGVAKNNPGQAAIGVLVTDGAGDTLIELSEEIGNATSEYAEYFAVVRGLQETAQLLGNKTHKVNFELKLENEMVRNHMSAKEQINDVSLIGHFIEIFNVRVAHFPHLEIILIKESENTLARQLASSALDVQ